MHGCVDASGLPPVYAALAATPKGGERIVLQGLYQTRANAPDAATSIPPVCLPSTKDSFMACRHHTTNSSDLESEISLPQVLVMSTMQTQALFAVLRDFDLADSRRGLSVDEAVRLKSRCTEKSACVCMVDMTETCGREIPLSRSLEFVAW